MNHTILVNEELLNQRADLVETRGLLPELVFRLIAASIQNPTDLRIPIGASIGQKGNDGRVGSPIAFDPYVPLGFSIWEMGVGAAANKATDDFERRDEKMSAEEKMQTTFVFVTPRSAYTDWSLPAQEAWIAQRNNRGWKKIMIIDGTKLVQWTYLFPQFDLWLASKLGIQTKGVTSPGVAWSKLSSYPRSHTFTPQVFLNGRDEALNKVKALLRGETRELRIDAQVPSDAIDFVLAAIASLDPAEQAAYGGRGLLVRDPTTWEGLCTLTNPHILIAEPAIDLGGTNADLRQVAHLGGHRVIYACTPSVSGHGNAVRLREYDPPELMRLLQQSKFPEELARNLARKAGGRLSTLKKILLDVTVAPEWASGEAAENLRLAALIGQWDGENPRDIAAIEGLLGKTYGEWIGAMRKVTLLPDAPLSQRNEKWRIPSRFEALQFLGPLMSNADLTKFRDLVVKVLKEPSPELTLPADDRWLAGIKKLPPFYSSTFREGIAETLALLASHPTFLTTATDVNVEGVAVSAVHGILEAGDWKRWASLQPVLPYLAEAAPKEFIKSVRAALDADSSPIVALFGQESGAITGRTYISGLLWALETLAWDADLLVHVTKILGQLASVDPGGQWNNRPENSLKAIFMPWRPQTSASVEKRAKALQGLLRDYPVVGWKILLELLPDHHQATSETRHPAWREWSLSSPEANVSVRAYISHVESLADVALATASTDPAKLKELIERIAYLPQIATDKILSHIEKIAPTLEDGDKYTIWQETSDLIKQHTRFRSAEWAMPKERLDKVVSASQKLEPNSKSWRYRRWFSGRDMDLYGQGDDFEKLEVQLQAQKRELVADLLAEGGNAAIIQFAKDVEKPGDVGLAVGSLPGIELDTTLLLPLLATDENKILYFAAGYIIGRFGLLGFEWARKMAASIQSDNQRAVFIACLPFRPETWKLADELLGVSSDEYWLKANPYARGHPAKEWEYSLSRLLKVKRAPAALELLSRLIHVRVDLSQSLVADVLEQLAAGPFSAREVRADDIRRAIKWLQDNSGADEERLKRIEAIYLRLLNQMDGVTAKTLERELASDPRVFWELISTAFNPKDAPKEDDPSEERMAAATNAYHLLHNCQTIPGRRDDGSIDEQKLTSWYQEVRELCGKSGHLEIALEQFGQILALAPKDKDGTWPAPPIARLLDQKDAASVRLGFRIALFNNQGARFMNAGASEKGFAMEYRKQAEAIEHLYSRLALTFQDLADSYEDLAKRYATGD